jgi:hypothetical protein
VHARKFANVNGLLPTSPSRKGWTPTKESLIPAKEHVTNDNLEEFIVQCWEDGSKPNVTQGRRYINHILTHHGEPPMNKNFRQKYASVLDVLAGLKREEKWRNHTSKGAKPLSLAYVKKILMAPVHDHAGNLDLLRLRNKTLAACLILCGWHQKDAYDILDRCVINLEDHHDRDGHHRPKFMFNDIFHNKRGHWKVCNTVGCGCKGCHQPKNSNCPYNLLLWYAQEKEECDDKLRLRKSKLSRPERLKHFDEHGHLKERHFFRSITRAGYEHRNLGQHGIRGVLEFWRPILGLGDVKLTTDMARKTFCTLGAKYTGLETNIPVLFKIPDQQLMDVTHHKSHDQFQKYVVNATWRDPEAEGHAGRLFSLWAQDHYKPPLSACVPAALGHIDETNKSGFGSMKRAAKSINSIRLILDELKSIRSRGDSD